MSRSRRRVGPPGRRGRRPCGLLTVALVLGLGAACIPLVPNVVDVSSFPPDVQQQYELFSRKCSRCHTIERPLTAQVDPDRWIDTVRRMSRHPGAGISEREQNEIAAFLKYYAEHTPRSRAKIEKTEKTETPGTPEKPSAPEKTSAPEKPSAPERPAERPAEKPEQSEQP